MSAELQPDLMRALDRMRDKLMAEAEKPLTSSSREAFVCRACVVEINPFEWCPRCGGSPSLGWVVYGAPRAEERDGG
mgnify:CR=1 FL=1